MIPIDCYYTNHFINQTVVQLFSKSLGLPLIDIKEYKETNNIFASYGILRGTGDIIKKRKKNFIYIDHGYFNSSSRRFTKEKNTILSGLEGYFRIIKDDLYFNNYNFTNDRKRFNDLDINLKEKKAGDIIILSEPTQNTLDFLGLNNWKEKTIEEIKLYTDREIIVHNKFSKQSLDSLLVNAWAFISLQSAAGFKAMINGIPAYFTEETLKNINPIQEIENPKINYKIFNNLAYGQWTLNEIESGEAWENIIHYNK